MLERLLFCSRGKHSRMRRFARRKGEVYVSRCRWCDTALIRDDDGEWIAMTQGEAHQPAADKPV